MKKKKMRKLQLRTTNTGLKGISKHKATGKFEVRVNVRNNSKSSSYYVGLTATTEEAVRMRTNFITNLY
tara:strand:+ start:1414 stop:1620 length:207 start_codon:yes stop_codon:yes gene_type:complete